MTFPTMTAVVVAGTAVAVVVLVRTEVRSRLRRRGAKMVASTGFVAVAVAAGAPASPYGRAVLIALLLSWLGDLFLTFPARRAFLFGLGAFFAAHVVYTASFLIRGVSAPAVGAAAAGAAVASLLVWWWLRPHVETAMGAPVAAYIAAISVMVATAFGSAVSSWDPRIAAGATAFFASDIAVARDRFVAPGFVNRMWGLPLYYLAQVLLALSAGA
jgi:uncharacterized membrane protein YhhN